MDTKYESVNDIKNDTKAGDGNRNMDFGGELASDEGVNLNAKDNPTIAKDDQNHLDQFRDGAVRISSGERGQAYSPYVSSGPPEGTYVIPESVSNDIINQSEGNPRTLEQLLGKPEGSLGETPMLTTFDNPRNIRMPDGSEPGTNENFIPGGTTSGGIPEAVIDPEIPGHYSIRPVFEDVDDADE